MDNKKIEVVVEGAKSEVLYRIRVEGKTVYMTKTPLVAVKVADAIVLSLRTAGCEVFDTRLVNVWVDQFGD